MIQAGGLHTHLQQGLSRLLCLGRETHKCVILWFGVADWAEPLHEGVTALHSLCGALQVMSNGSEHLIFKNFLLRFLWAKPDDFFSPSVFRSCVCRAFHLCCLGLGPLVSCFLWCTNIPESCAGPGWVTAEGFLLHSGATDPYHQVVQAVGRYCFSSWEKIILGYQQTC